LCQELPEQQGYGHWPYEGASYFLFFSVNFFLLPAD
jgi:hypothetical protein